MKKNKDIRSKLVKESLVDYEAMTETLKENTESAIKSLLDEAVRDTYNKILSESEEDEYDEEEVEDTNVDSLDDENETEDVDVDTEETEETEDDVDTDAEESEDELEDDLEDNGEEDVDVNVDDDSVEISASGEDEEGNEWDEFEKYKVGDDEYDFSEAEDEEIVKVYKLLKDDDQVMVTKTDNKINIKDNETGAEYLVDLDGDYEDTDTSFEDDLQFDDEEDDIMKESIIYEVALNEYDSNVGYTDNYQKKDVMSNPGMSEPGKNVNDWDAGVPKGDAKPWSGYPGKKKKADKPFNDGKGKKVEECGLTDNGMINDEEEIEEGAGRYGKVQRHTKAKKHTGTNPEEKKNPKVSHSDSNSEDGYKADNTNESIMRKANQIFKENAELKKALTNFKRVLNEAAVTNVNLGNIIKLISENATSQDEKREIISRFGNEAMTVKQSNKLYESIARQLKRNEKLNINEDKQFTTGGSKRINETTIYKSKDMLNSLDLMHRLCK